jgi:hypothetical protein
LIHQVRVFSLQGKGNLEAEYFNKRPSAANLHFINSCVVYTQVRSQFDLT